MKWVSCEIEKPPRDIIICIKTYDNKIFIGIIDKLKYFGEYLRDIIDFDIIHIKDIKEWCEII